MNKTSNIIAQIENMYNFFNRELDAKLPEDIVFSLIPNRGRANYYGWFARSRWVCSENRLHEINIASDYLNRSINDIAETLIHEMTHLKNAVNNIKDCTPTQYHNKNFKKQAEEFGLKVEKMRNRGYASTSLDEKAMRIVDAYKNNVLMGSNPFLLHRVTEISLGKINNKTMVSVDNDLAEDIRNITGLKLSRATSVILRDWVHNKQTVLQ